MSLLTITKKVTVLVTLLFLFVGITGYFLMLHLENKTIENQALSISEIVARQSAAARAVYTDNILGKLREDGVAYPDADFHGKPGALPIPSQFLKKMARNASETSEGLYQYHALSKWNLSDHGGIEHEFVRKAWAELEKQDKANPDGPIDWKPIHTVQQFKGQQTFLYLRAAPAAHDACVECHNRYELKRDIIQRRSEQSVTPRKQWKKHQLMGAMFVRIPIESMQAAASKQNTFILLWILGALTAGLGALALFFSRDLIKARKIRRRLFWQAKHDTLTRLPNRNGFEQQLHQLMLDAKTHQTTHALCYMDLDHFKLVNDTCGHAVGDELLIDISKLFREHLDDEAFLARLGGDEFALLLKNCRVDQAKAIAESLCETTKNYQFKRGEHQFDIGVSIGVAAIDEHAESVDKLKRCADLACYAAKEAGKNRTRVYENTDVSLNLKEAEASWVSEMIRALDENRIIIYSQKIGSVRAGLHYAHHEILVRMLDKDGNLVLPNHFIPAAERYKMMPKLDLAIIDRALCALSNGYFKDLGDNGFISINLSGQSLSEPDFLLNVKYLMMKYRVNTQQVCFEITESSAIANPILVKQFMKEMKRLGVKFALDDFGTGLSSLTYLKQFPVDYLKIDGSFIRDIVSDSIDRSLVDAINKMAHTMGLKTIAEYVESQEILTLLNAINIDYAQGYHIQKPTPVDVG